MNVILISAQAHDRIIGKAGSIPWQNPDDMRFFKANTMGNVCIMGRKTFESLPAPLKGRTNIVITRNVFNKETSDDNVIFMDSLTSALTWCVQSEKENVFICGGAEIYKEALPFATILLTTRIPEYFRDTPDLTRFPKTDIREWEFRSLFTLDGRDPIHFTGTYVTVHTRKDLMKSSNFTVYVPKSEKIKEFSFTIQVKQDETSL